MTESVAAAVFMKIENELLLASTDDNDDQAVRTNVKINISGFSGSFFVMFAVRKFPLPMKPAHAHVCFSGLPQLH